MAWGSIPGWGTKILQAAQCSKKEKKKCVWMGEQSQFWWKRSSELMMWGWWAGGPAWVMAGHEIEAILDCGWVVI